MFEHGSGSRFNLRRRARASRLLLGEERAAASSRRLAHRRTSNRCTALMLILRCDSHCSCVPPLSRSCWRVPVAAFGVVIVADSGVCRPWSLLPKCCCLSCRFGLARLLTAVFVFLCVRAKRFAHDWLNSVAQPACLSVWTAPPLPRSLSTHTTATATATASDTTGDGRVCVCVCVCTWRWSWRRVSSVSLSLLSLDRRPPRLVCLSLQSLTLLCNITSPS